MGWWWAGPWPGRGPWSYLPPWRRPCWRYYWWQAPPYVYTPVDEIRALEDYARLLEEELQSVRRRIEELKAASRSPQR